MTLTAGCHQGDLTAHDAGRGTQLDQSQATPPGRYLASIEGHGISESEFKKAISEARLLRHWKSGKPAGLEALKDLQFRRKLLVRALETRVVRSEVARLGVRSKPGVIERLLAQAALGIPPQRLPSDAELLRAPTNPEELDGRLVARYEMPAVVAHQVASDLAQHSAFAEHLLSETPEAAIREDWRSRRTCFRAKIYRVARVPTSPEIDQAIDKFTAESRTYYQENGRLFRRPARLFLRRFLVPKTDGATEETDQAGRQKAIQVRERILQGADMEAIVREEGSPRDRRNGGRLTVKQSEKPEFTQHKDGALTPVIWTPKGWAFFRIEGRGDALIRPFSDPRVRREIAAAVLRERDELPHAQRQAQSLRTLLLDETSPKELEAWLMKNRVRTTTTKRFCESLGRRVPTVGLAPELASKIHTLTAVGQVTPVVHIRQDYILAKVTEIDTPKMGDWPREKTTFVAAWRDRVGPTIVRSWLTRHLRSKALNIAVDRLRGYSVDQLVDSRPSGD